MDRLRTILSASGFKFSKRLGQNFISDANLLDAIAADAGIGASDVVVEVGAGAGTLTAALARRAASVIAVEIDERLMPVLEQTLSNLDNVEVIFGDILKLPPEELRSRAGGRFKLAANLPYYITTPIIFYFLENGFELESMTVMVQKEVADRMTAGHDTPEYGVLTASLWLFGDAEIVRRVDKRNFVPQPEVDSAIVKITTVDRGIADIKRAQSVVRSAFAMRRKTLINNLTVSFGVSRERCCEVLERLGVPQNARGESLPPKMLLRIAEELFA